MADRLVGNRCAPRRAYGDWLEREHDPLRDESKVITLRNVPGLPDGDYVVCICRHCGSLYVQHISDL